jgi:O-antigen/teichoic acid export membrane protein
LSANQNACKGTALAAVTAPPLAAQPGRPDELAGYVKIFAKGTGLNLIGGLFNRSLTMALQIALARLLGAADFGLYAIGLTLVRILVTIAPLGLNQSVQYCLPAYGGGVLARRRDVIVQSLGLTFIFGIVSAAFLYAGAHFLATIIFRKPEVEGALKLFAPLVAVMGFSGVASSTTRISLRMHYTLLGDLIATLTNLLLVLACFWLGWRLAGAIFSAVTAYCLMDTVTIVFIWRIFRRELCSRGPLTPLFGRLLGYGIPLAASALWMALLSWSDRLFVGIYCSKVETGVYQSAAQLSLIFVAGLVSVAIALAPMAARLNAEGEHAKLEQLFRTATKWCINATLPLFLAVSFCAPELMRVLYGPAFEAGGIPLILLALGQVVNSATGPLTTILAMTGHNNPLFGISLVTLAIDTLLNLMLVPRFGTVGAASVSLVASLMLNGLGLIAVIRLLSMQPYDSKCMKGLVSAVLCSVFLLILRSVIAPGSLVLLPVSFGVSFVGFSACLWLFGLDDEDITLYRELRTTLAASLGR